MKTCMKSLIKNCVVGLKIRVNNNNIHNRESFSYFFSLWLLTFRIFCLIGLVNKMFKTLHFGFEIKSVVPKSSNSDKIILLFRKWQNK